MGKSFYAKTKHESSYNCFRRSLLVLYDLKLFLNNITLSVVKEMAVVFDKKQMTNKNYLVCKNGTIHGSTVH